MRRTTQPEPKYSSADTTHTEVLLHQLQNELASLEQDYLVNFALSEVSVAIEALEMRRQFRAMHSKRT